MAGIVRADTFRMNTIKSQDSDVTAMTVDTSGRISRSVIPAFRAVGSSSYVAYTSGDTLVYDNVSGNGLYNLGGHYNTSTSTFTAPMDGLYYFKANALIQSEGGAGIQLRHGTLGILARSYDHGRDFNCSAVFNLSSGDTIYVTTESTTSYYLGTYAAFQGYMIG